MWLRVNNGEWEKTFSPEPNVWTWSTYIDFEVPGMPQEFDPTYNLDEGIHTIQISPRSEGFNIDRILLTKNNPSDYYDANIPTTPTCPGWAQP